MRRFQPFSTVFPVFVQRGNKRSKTAENGARLLNGIGHGDGLDYERRAS